MLLPFSLWSLTVCRPPPWGAQSWEGPEIVSRARSWPPLPRLQHQHTLLFLTRESRPSAPCCLQLGFQLWCLVSTGSLGFCSRAFRHPIAFFCFLLLRCQYQMVSRPRFLVDVVCGSGSATLVALSAAMTGISGRLQNYAVVASILAEILPCRWSCPTGCLPFACT